MKMYTYLLNLFTYFEHAFHPAGPRSSSSSTPEKRKTRTAVKGHALNLSPDGFNIRGSVSKKQDKLRRNPAP
jgi:hypothetical protein